MRIKWLGHAAFLIAAEDGTRIVTDPYEPGFRGIISYAPIAEAADVVTVSHEHGDHNYVDAVAGNPIAVRGAGVQTARGIEFTGHAGFHDNVGGAQRGRNTMFTFTVDGLRVCHMGDVGHPLNREQLEALGQVDVLLLPTGGPGATLDMDELNDLWERIGARITIPMHFKNVRCSFPTHGVDRFLEGKARVQRLSSTETAITAAELPSELAVIVLQHAR